LPAVETRRNARSCLHLEVTVTGKQAHAAMPETGVEMAIALPRADYQRE
jgi:metal-dependent amidase/aminoacylase/carboxypeptidase family protein